MGILGQNRGRGGVILTPYELSLTFGGCCLCAKFGENRSRNATVTVPTDRYTHWQTDRSTQNGFYSASALLAMQSAVLARGILSVRLSVCPSRSGIVSRRMKIRSCGFQHLVGQSL